MDGDQIRAGRAFVRIRNRGACGFAWAGSLIWWLLCLLIGFAAAASGQEPTLADPLLRWGTPEGTVIREKQWCFAFDGRTRCARWTLEYLDAATLAGDAPREDKFFEDLRVPQEFRPRLADYAKCGFDRGHLAAAGNFGESGSKAATFSLLNIAPQHGRLNRGPWRNLEGQIRTRAKTEEVWVLTCPLWLAEGDRVQYRVIGPTQVAVPTHFGKSVLVIDRENQPHLQAWIAPNREPAAVLPEAWRATVDALERAAGLDLWAGLPDELEDKLEAQR